MVRIGLKAAIMGKGWTQREFSRVSGCPENRLSELVRGWTDPTPMERARFVKLLQQPEDALFNADTHLELRSVR
jgi:plasmid maintenance system antidote protein VapI